jgi:hypothetical protein
VNKKQSGSAHLVIIIVLSLVLLGVLGFVCYQNFIQNKDTVSKTDTDKNKTVDKKSQEATTPTIEPATVVNDFLSTFLLYMSSTTARSDASFAEQNAALTREFRDRITNPNQGLSSSPITLAQDLPNSFTIGDVTEVDNAQNVPVTLEFTNGDLKIVYSLIIVDDEWKIDSVSRQ